MPSQISAVPSQTISKVQSILIKYGATFYKNNKEAKPFNNGET